MRFLINLLFTSIIVYAISLPLFYFIADINIGLKEFISIYITMILFDFVIFMKNFLEVRNNESKSKV